MGGKKVKFLLEILIRIILGTKARWGVALFDCVRTPSGRSMEIVCCAVRLLNGRK
jgi:hypothetical protein